MTTAAGGPRGEIVLIAGKDPLLEIGGGHSAYVRAHARAVLRAGFQPRLFCVSDRSGVVEADYGVVHRIKSIVPFRVSVGMGSPHYLSLVPLHSLQIAAGITRHLLPLPGPHLVHGFGAWGWAGCLAGESLRRRGVLAIPLLSVYTSIVHESEAKVRAATAHSPLGGRLRFLAREAWVRAAAGRAEGCALAGAARILLNYESVRRILPGGPHPEPRCHRLPYASEAAFRDGSADAGPARDVHAKPPLIVAVSRHDPRKGIDVLLAALSRIHARGIPFRARLVGGGPLIEVHRRLAESLDLAVDVRIEGFVEDVTPHLREADIFVLPSLEEGSGSLSLLEALQEGVAAVASSCDGIPEDVRDEDSALLVPPGDAGALADALVRLLEDPALRGRLSGRARETFEARFTAARFTEALLATYEAALASPDVA
jgi:glycosyltransferase involved in cell wall biosynthesis